MYMLPYLALTDDEGRCVELANNLRTRHYMTTMQGDRWESLSSCEDCFPACIDDPETVYTTPSEDGTWWVSENTDPASDEFLGLFVRSLWVEPVTSQRRRGDTLTQPIGYSPRRMELVGELLTDTVRGSALAFDQLRNVLASCGSNGFTATVHQFCPDENEPIDITAESVQARTWNEPTIPVATLHNDCDSCARIDPNVWQPTLLPTDAGEILVNVDSGVRILNQVRVVSIDEDPDGADLREHEGIPVKVVFEIFDDSTLGEPLPLPTFAGTVPAPSDISKDGALLIDCDPNNTSGIEFDCDSEPTGNPGEVIADCAESRGADIRPFRWDWLCLQTGSTDTCVVTPSALGARPPVTAPSGYNFPMWRRVESMLIPRMPSPVDGALQLEIQTGGAELANLRIELWPAWDNVEDPATCTGESHYRTIVPCETFELNSPIAAGSVLRIDGAARAVTLSCLGSPFTGAERFLSGARGTRTRHPRLSPDCRWWLVATYDANRSAADATITGSFVPVH